MLSRLSIIVLSPFRLIFRMIFISKIYSTFHDRSRWLNVRRFYFNIVLDDSLSCLSRSLGQYRWEVMLILLGLSWWRTLGVEWHARDEAWRDCNRMIVSRGLLNAVPYEMPITRSRVKFCIIRVLWFVKKTKKNKYRHPRNPNSGKE